MRLPLAVTVVLRFIVFQADHFDELIMPAQTTRCTYLMPDQQPCGCRRHIVARRAQSPVTCKRQLRQTC
jgi:hypothetical protein